MKNALRIAAILLVIASPVFGMNTVTQDTHHNFTSGVFSQSQVRGQGPPAQVELQFAFQPVSMGFPWPQVRVWHGAAYDQSGGSVLLFGGLGTTVLGDTWKFNPATNKWMSVPVSTGPDARSGHVMAASGDGKIILFGGHDAGNRSFNDTWVYSFTDNDWHGQVTSSAPGKRFFSAAAADPAAQKIVLFGGRAEDGSLLGDTWVYDIALASWTYRNAPGPSARYGAAMAYHPGDQKYYLFGGNENSFGLSGGRKQDLWKYDESINTWNLVTPVGAPPTRREDAGMCYDPLNSRLLIWGGVDNSDGFDDRVWYFNRGTSQWYSDVPISGPAGRSGHSLLFLPESERALLFGGFNSVKMNDAAYYAYRGTGSYTSTALQTGYAETSLQWRKLSVSPSVQPAGTAIKFQVASSPDDATWGQFLGPDGTTSYYEGASEYTLWQGHGDNRYLKYRAELSATQPPESPVIDSVVLSYNYAPRTPVPALPLNGGSTNYLLPLFMWNNTSDPDNEAVFNDTVTYHIQVDSWTGFGTPDINETAVSSAAGGTSSYRSAAALSHGVWYWRVRAYDGYACGNWSAPRTLYVDTAAPSAVTDLAAKTGGLNGQVELSWTVPPDQNPSPAVSSMNYYIRYATYGPLTPALYDGLPDSEQTGTMSPIAGAAVTVNANGLADGTTYFFALKIADSAGNLSGMATTTPAAFTNAAPSVSLISPSGGENWTGEQEIRWSASDPNPNDALAFTIASSRDGGGNYDVTIVTGLAGSTTCYVWDTRGVSNGTAHAVRITATDARGLSGSAGTAGVFTVFNGNEAPSLAIVAPYEGQAASGTIVLAWRVTDVNGADCHVYTISLSSTGGDTFFWQAVTSATSYALNTAGLGNGPSYRLHISAVDSGTPPLAGEASVSFRIDNHNHPPNPFALISPANGSAQSPLLLDFKWENNGDPNPEDTLVYTLVISTDADFSGAVTVTGIRENHYRVNAMDLEAERGYYWKVTARDPLGLEQTGSQAYWTVILSRFKADSDDGKVSIAAAGGMPAGGYLTIESLAHTGYPAIRAANEETLANRHIRLLGESAYRVRVRELTGRDIPAPGLSLSVVMRYPDTNGDGNYDGTEVPAASLRCAVLDEAAERWELAPELPVLDRSFTKITTTIRSAGIIGVMGALSPLKRLSAVVNYPNPFAAGREETRIKYVLTEDQPVTASIYTLMGDLVWRHSYAAGGEGGKGQSSGFCNEIRWDGKNDSGMAVADGMYILELKAGQDRELRKIGVVK